MANSALELRLQQLEGHIVEILKLLSEYEEELLDEDDPKKKRRHRRQIEDLKQQKVTYEEEFSELTGHLKTEQTAQSQTIAAQLQEIDSKVEFLLDGQYAIGNMLFSHFKRKDEELIRPVVQKLGSSQQINIESFLQAIDNNQISEQEIQRVLTEVQNLVAVMRAKGISLPSPERALIDAIEAPKIETKHALKLSIPIIPFLLSYEGDLGIGAGVNLKELWQSLKTKVI